MHLHPVMLRAYLRRMGGLRILRLYAWPSDSGVSQSRSMCIAVGKEGWERTVGVDSVSHGAGGSEIGEELEAQADDEVPDVSGHLRTGDENAPDEDYQDGVESVANVPQLVQVFACRWES